jgi:hypothetical protein
LILFIQEGGAHGSFRTETPGSRVPTKVVATLSSPRLPLCLTSDDPIRAGAVCSGQEASRPRSPCFTHRDHRCVGVAMAPVWSPHPPDRPHGSPLVNSPRHDATIGLRGGALLAVSTGGSRGLGRLMVSHDIINIYLD